MNITEHFTLAELTRTSQPIPNEPGAPEMSNLRALCQFVLEPVRARFGAVKVNSAYRSLRVNRAIGSKDNSQHRLGEAADIEVERVANADLARWIANNVPFDQLILEAYRPGVPGSGWVHVSYRAGRLRHDVLTMTMGSHGPIYSKGLAV
jgi:hypothetical protein